MRDERAREKWGEDKKKREGGGKKERKSRALSSHDDLLEEKRGLLAVYKNRLLKNFAKTFHVATV